MQACLAAILQNNRRDNVQKKTMIRMILPSGWDSTKHIPPEPRPDGKNRLREINAEIILLWLWQHHLCDYTPNMIYEANRGLFTGFKFIDAEFEDMYNDVIDE